MYQRQDFREAFRYGFTRDMALVSADPLPAGQRQAAAKGVQKYASQKH